MIARRFPAAMAASLPNRNPVIAPVGEQGFLTPVRPTFGDPATYIWTCRCGATVTRPAKSVRKSVKDGATPRCSPKCDGLNKETSAA